MYFGAQSDEDQIQWMEAIRMGTVYGSKNLYIRAAITMKHTIRSKSINHV